MVYKVTGTILAIVVVLVFLMPKQVVELPVDQSIASEEDFLSGDWSIIATTFPMWLKGDKRCPGLHYRLIEKGRWSDLVSYETSQGEEYIKGVDTQSLGSPAKITWRGSGWLFFVTSDWAISARGKHWMIIAFDATWFTPRGVDVLSDGSQLSQEDWRAIDAVMKGDRYLNALWPLLRPLDRSKCDP